jgi:hypothetical protein
MSNVYIIPVVPSEPEQAFSTNLEGTQYAFTFRWNGTDRAWYMSVLTADTDEPIRANMRVVLGSILRGSVDARFPPGVFFAYDTSRTGVDAGLDDLGTRVEVLYIPYEV